MSHMDRGDPIILFVDSEIGAARGQLAFDLTCRRLAVTYGLQLTHVRESVHFYEVRAP